jgi:hypothetical protein
VEQRNRTGIFVPRLLYRTGSIPFESTEAEPAQVELADQSHVCKTQLVEQPRVCLHLFGPSSVWDKSSPSAFKRRMLYSKPHRVKLEEHLLPPRMTAITVGGNSLATGFGGVEGLR